MTSCEICEAPIRSGRDLCPECDPGPAVPCFVEDPLIEDPYLEIGGGVVIRTCTIPVTTDGVERCYLPIGHEGPHLRRPARTCPTCRRDGALSRQEEARRRAG